MTDDRQYREAYDRVVAASKEQRPWRAARPEHVIVTTEIDRYVWLALGGIVAFGVLCGVVGWLAGLWTAQMWWAG